MANVITAPIVISPEAADHVAALGFRAELDCMIERAVEVFSDLRYLEVTREESPEEDDVGIVLWAYAIWPGGTYDRREADFGGRKVRTFSPDVCRHFVLTSVYGEPPNGR